MRHHRRNRFKKFNDLEILGRFSEATGPQDIDLTFLQKALGLCPEGAEKAATLLGLRIQTEDIPDLPENNEPA
jgi:hypothetical protein